MKSLYADIALPVPVDKPFTYVVPPELHGAARVGCRALVPFGRRHLIGYIVTLSDSTPLSNLKAVRDIVDSEPTMTDELLRLTQWVASYYFAPWGEVLKAAVPKGLAFEGKRTVRLCAEEAVTLGTSAVEKSKRRQEILKQLKPSAGITIASLQKKLGSKSIYAILNQLAREGIVEIDEGIPQLGMKPKKLKVVPLLDGFRDRWRKEVNHLPAREASRGTHQILRARS